MHVLWKQCDDDDHICFKLAEIPWLTVKNVLQKSKCAATSKFCKHGINTKTNKKKCNIKVPQDKNVAITETEQEQKPTNPQNKCRGKMLQKTKTLNSISTNVWLLIRIF